MLAALDARRDAVQLRQVVTHRAQSPDHHRPPQHGELVDQRPALVHAAVVNQAGENPAEEIQARTRERLHQGGGRHGGVLAEEKADRVAGRRPQSARGLHHELKIVPFDVHVQLPSRRRTAASHPPGAAPAAGRPQSFVISARNASAVTGLTSTRSAPHRSMRATFPPPG